MNQHRLFATTRSAAQQHEHMRALLPEYAALDANGAQVDATWHDFEEHLAVCAACREELTAIRALLHATSAGTLPLALEYPVPNLSFLPSPPAVGVAQLAGQQMVSSVQGALDSLRHLIQFSETLLDRLRQPELAGKYRGGQLCSYQHPREDEHDLHITIDVSVTETTGTPCRVVVSVVDPQRPFDLEGSVVNMRYATCTHEAITDQQGYVAFNDVPATMLSQLQFTITPRRD